MRKFTDPLDNIRIASPCPANWDEMFGDARKRFCGECKLNVYNLSNMTRHEAENLLINSEGRLCVRFFRRSDGTVLTQNCPVGWAAVKQRVSRVATAVFSIVAGLLGGLLAFNLLESRPAATVGELRIEHPNSIQGDVSPVNYNSYQGDVMGTLPAMGEMTMGKPAAPINRKPGSK